MCQDDIQSMLKNGNFAQCYDKINTWNKQCSLARTQESSLWRKVFNGDMRNE